MGKYLGDVVGNFRIEVRFQKGFGYILRCYMTFARPIQDLRKNHWYRSWQKSGLFASIDLDEYNYRLQRLANVIFWVESAEFQQLLENWFSSRVFLSHTYIATTYQDYKGFFGQILILEQDYCSIDCSSFTHVHIWHCIGHFVFIHS